jgi:plastocyanin
MEPEKNDQEQFDENVNRIGKYVLEVLAGVGVFAAVIMSMVALLNSGSTTVKVVGTRAASTSATAAPARTAPPTTAHVMIEHAMRGCHDLAVNGGSANSPNATLKLAVGGTMYVQDNDVMPHTLYLRSGPQPQFVTPKMSHMGAGSTVTFTKPGTYVLGTHAGEDYTKGVMTVGADHVLKIKVLVS